MDNEPQKLKIHPLTAAAAVAVILVSVTGIAAMTGILPNFSKSDPVAVTTPAEVTAGITASQPVAAPAHPPAPPVNESVQAVAPAKKTVVRKPAQVASAAPVRAMPAPVEVAPVVAPPPPPPCINCGVVESAHVIQQQAPASGLGAAAGAVLGGVLGHQVGGGNGKTLATIAGAVGGGLAGNAVEKNSKTSSTYEVIVVMDNGSRQRFLMDVQRWRQGDLVQIVNGQIVARTQ